MWHISAMTGRADPFDPDDRLYDSINEAELGIVLRVLTKR